MSRVTTRFLVRQLTIGIVAVGVLTPSTAHAQLLSSLAPATCGTPTVAGVNRTAIDSTLITGVVVRLAAGKSDKDIDQFLSHAMSSAISAHLERYINAPVQTRADANRRSTTANDAREAAAAAIAEGRILGVQWVVSGSVERKRDTTTVNWRVHDARTGQQRSSGTLKAPLTSLDSVANHIARTLAPDISASVGTPSMLRNARSSSVAAFDLLLEGLYRIESFDPASWQRGEQVLADAVRADGNLLAAWQSLADVRLRVLQWGGRGTEAQRAGRSAAAVAAAHRALAIDNQDVRSLALVARAHLLRGELTPAAQAIEGIRRIAPRSLLLAPLELQHALLNDDDKQLAALHGAMDYRQMRNADALFARAEWHRRNRRDVDACRTLNRILTLNPGWAPAVAMRAVVRARLGDRRGAWVDAEIVTRLGRPEWGRPISALTDVAAADTARATERLRAVAAPPNGTAASYLETLFNGAALLAIKKVDRATAVLGAVSCDDPYRRLLASDPLLAGYTGTASCRATSAKP